jgi:hypothetical protein
MIENKPGPSLPAGQGILCAKCEHLNQPGSNTCGHCGSHLYIACSKCGHSNQRALSRCTRCGHRLHRSVWHRWKRRITRGNRKVHPLHLVLLVLSVIVVYKIIVKLAEYRPPTPD